MPNRRWSKWKGCYTEAVSYEKVGDVLVTQGKLDEALKAYRDRRVIAERLAAADPSNAEWQRDLAVSHAKLASVYEKQGRIADALIEVTKARDIMAALAAITPRDARWKRDLAWLESEVVRLQEQARQARPN
jgi:tetratricopeptide (TPR) repeat protein